MESIERMEGTAGGGSREKRKERETIVDDFFPCISYHHIINSLTIIIYASEYFAFRPNDQIHHSRSSSALIIIRIILTVELVLVEVDGGDLPTVEGTAGKLLDGLARICWGHILEEDLGKAGSRSGDDDVLEGTERSALLLGILPS